MSTTAEPDTIETTSKPAAGLFDKSQYNDPALRIAKVDDQDIEKIRLSFTGTIMLDRGSAADVALYRKLTLGKGDVTLQVEGRCSASGAKQATNKEGDLDVVVGEKTVKILTIYIHETPYSDESAKPAMTVARTDDDEDGGEPFNEAA